MIADGSAPLRPVSPGWPEPAAPAADRVPAARPQAPGPAARPAAPVVVGTPAARTDAVAGTAARPASVAAAPVAAPLPQPAGPPRIPVRPPHAMPLAAPAAPPRAPSGDLVREYVRHLGVLQVICWQLAALAVLLAVRQPWPVLVTACAGAALVLALTAVRVGGRWLYQVAALAVGFLTRPRRCDLPETGGRTPALLDLLAPGMTVRVIETSAGPAMTVSHPAGLAAVLRPREQVGDPTVRLPPPAALLPVADDQPNRYGVQTICHAGVRRDGPPKVWFAVHATRTAESPHDEELSLALRNAMRRVRRALDRAGVPAEPLAEDAAFAAIAGLAHVTGGRNEVREDWRFWRTGPVSQATFALPGLDRLTDPQTRRLVADLFAVTTGVAATVALSARSGRTGALVSGALRLAATTEVAVENAAAAAARIVPAGVRLARLDGTHSSGVAASLPIGVF